MLRSIRWTLQLWHAGLLAVVLTAFGGVTFYEIRRARFAQADAALERVAQLVVGGVRPPDRRPFERPDFDRPGFDRRGYGREPFLPDRPTDRPHDGDRDRDSPRGMQVSPTLVERFAETAGEGDYFVLWGRFGELLGRSANAPELQMPGPADKRGPDGRPDDRDDDGRPRQRDPEPTALRWRDGYREAVVRGPFMVQAVVGHSVRTEVDDLRRLGWLMIGTGGGVLAIGLAGGLALASRVTRPIANITAAAEAVTATSLSRRIDVSDTESELGRLAAVLNGTFARLESAFAQQVRFTADASHELRTPLAVVHSAVQLALSKDRSAESYRTTLQTVQRASTRMKELVDSLLLLAGVDAGRLTLDRAPVDLAARVEETAEMLMPLAAEKGVTIEVAADVVTAIADATRINQVLTNLISNAVRYNRPGGSVRVTLRREGDDAVIDVADTGVGIAAEHQVYLFDRFYRVDPARSRAEGGSGLGLAIVRGIVAAHGGSVTFRSTPGEGTTFTLRLPTNG